MATGKDLPKAMNSKTSAYSRFQKDNFYCSVCQESIFTRTETKEQHLFSKKHTIKELESTLFGPERTEDVNSFKVEYSGQSTESMRYKSSPKRDNAALTATLRKISADFGLTSKELEFRRSVFDYVQTSLISEDVDVGLELSLFGSSLTGAGLTGSNIDICLKATSSNTTTEAMLHALSSIEEDGCFVEVKDYLHKTPPRFSFEDPKNGLKCVISCGPEAEEALETSRMIERYMHLDAKVLILSQCFRYWAKVCRIDRKHEGTLSPYCFVLMVIHFLQTRHLVPLAKDVWKGKWTKEHDQPLSQLWVDLLRYYKAFLKTDECVVSIESFSRISKASQNWYQPFAIADPNVRRRNVANSLSKKVMDYFKSCFDKSFKYFNKDLPKSNGKPGERKPRCSTMTTSESEIESENVESLLDYDSDDESESEDDSSDEIAQSLKTNDEESLITFEDEDKNTDESENSDENENLNESENIDESEKNGENDGESDVKGENEDENKIKSENEDESHSSSSDDKYRSYNDYVIVEYDRAPLVEVESCDFAIRDKSNNALSSCGEERTSSLIGHFDDLRLIDFEASSSDAQQSQPRIRSSTSTSLEVETLYDFNRKNLCKEGSAPSFCCACKCLGHRRDDCSQVKKIVEPISAPNSTTKKALGIICDAVHEMLKPSPPDLDLRSSLLQQLQSYLCRDIPKAHLSLFGSSSNGLGFRSSDMDICIFMKDISEEYVNKTWLIKKLERLLRKCKFVGHLQVIRSAKIPIIKFTFVDGSVKLLEADLSLYNVLALENTRLISTYCCLDWRVRTLGYALKYFAKQCEIGDASRGTLSSYAHTMMLIHYLQQRNPPVVPVIQELGFAGKSKPQRLVDGWNTWFITDLNALFELWPGSGKNKESLGKLWLGFFRYYVEDFDFKRNVVSIRQSKPLRKFEKDWNRFDMAIEDPFQLDRNLSAGITTKVFKYISGIFEKARKLYSAAIDENFIQLNGKQHAISHFFNADYLCKDLKMPLDRLCRRCGKIGHTRKTCNMKPATSKKNKKKPREDGKQGQGVASEDVEAGESRRKDVVDGESSDPLNTASQRKASGNDEKRQSEERFEKSASKKSQGTDTDNLGRKILKAVRNRGKGSEGTQSNQNDDKDSLFKSRQADVRPRATGKRVAGSSTDGFSIENVYRDNDYTESGAILTKETSNMKPTRGSNKIQNKSDLLEKIDKLMKKAKALPPDDVHQIAEIQDEISVYEDKIQLAAVEKFSSRENASNSRIEFSLQNEASFEDEAGFQNQADLQNDAALQSQARGPSGKKKNKKKSEKTKPSNAGQEQAVFSEAAGQKEIKPGGKSKNKKDEAKSKQHIGSKESILSVEEHGATFAGDRSMPDKSEGENFHEKVPEGKGKEKRQRQRKEKKNLPPGANAIPSQFAAAQKAQKGVVRTNLGREDSLFLSMLDISPVVDFTKGKPFNDDTGIGKSRTQERGTHQTRDGHQDFGSQDRGFNGPEPYRGRGHPRGSPRGRGRGGRGQGTYHQGRQNDGQSEDRGRGHRSEDRGRGHRSEDRGRGHRSEDRGRGQGYSRGNNQARGQGHRGGRGNIRGRGRGQARGQYGERSNSSSFSDY